MNIQNFLHLERERQGLSKKEIAERAGCSHSHFILGTWKTEDWF